MFPIKEKINIHVTTHKMYRMIQKDGFKELVPFVGGMA